jgi:hypothetical protein
MSEGVSLHDPIYGLAVIYSLLNISLFILLYYTMSDTESNINLLARLLGLPLGTDSTFPA